MDAQLLRLDSTVQFVYQNKFTCLPIALVESDVLVVLVDTKSECTATHFNVNFGYGWGLTLL